MTEIPDETDEPRIGERLFAIHTENGDLEMAKAKQKKPKVQKISRHDQDLMDYGRNLALAVMLRSLCKTTEELYEMLRDIAGLAELEAAQEAFLKRQAAP